MIGKDEGKGGEKGGFLKNKKKKKIFYLHKLGIREGIENFPWGNGDNFPGGIHYSFSFPQKHDIYY